MLRERVQAGCSVIMATHILEVAERMADRIGVMANGTLIADGTLDELRRQVGAGHDAADVGSGRTGSGLHLLTDAGSGNATLEDTFLALVAQDETAV